MVGVEEGEMVEEGERVGEGIEMQGDYYWEGAGVDGILFLFDKGGDGDEIDILLFP